MAKRSRKTIVMISVLIGVIALGYFLYTKKQEELLKATLTGMDLGERYGLIVTQGQCLPGLKMKHGQCDNMACELSAHGFISECLRKAEKDNFCHAVPSPQNTSAALAWADKACSDLQMRETKCESFIHKALSVCEELKTGKERSAGDAFEDGFNRGYQQSK